MKIRKLCYWDVGGDWFVRELWLLQLSTRKIGNGIYAYHKWENIWSNPE